MKTPREVLFQKHQDMESKLDAVRAKALSEMAPVTRIKHHAPRHIQIADRLQELVHSFRPQLAALRSRLADHFRPASGFRRTIGEQIRSSLPRLLRNRGNVAGAETALLTVD